MLDASRRANLLRLVWEVVERVLDDKRSEAVGVEDELGARGALVAEDGHDALGSATTRNRNPVAELTHDELARLREQLDVLLGGEILDNVVRVLGQVAAEAERARVELSVDVRDEQLNGCVVVEAGDNLTSAAKDVRKLTISAYREEGWTKLS